MSLYAVICHAVSLSAARVRPIAFAVVCGRVCRDRSCAVPLYVVLCRSMPCSVVLRCAFPVAVGTPLSVGLGCAWPLCVSRCRCLAFSAATYGVIVGVLLALDAVLWRYMLLYIVRYRYVKFSPGVYRSRVGDIVILLSLCVVISRCVSLTRVGYRGVTWYSVFVRHISLSPVLSRYITVHGIIMRSISLHIVISRSLSLACVLSRCISCSIGIYRYFPFSPALPLAICCSLASVGVLCRRMASSVVPSRPLSPSLVISRSAVVGMSLCVYRRFSVW